jgi:hypothetical protein
MRNLRQRRTLRWIVRGLTVVALVSTCVAALGTPATADQSPVISGYGRSIRFSGYDWLVKSSTVLVGPGPNYFSDSEDNVWIDEQGRLHLRVTRDANGRWKASEVVLQASLGYGEYRFTIEGPPRELDPNVVLGLFTWKDEPAENHKELDVEIARWGDPAGPNGRYTLQTGHTYNFESPAATVPTTHVIDWQPDQVRFQSWEGSDTEPPSPVTTIAERVFDTGVPHPGGEQTRMNLWLNGGAAPLADGGLEAIVSSFEFSPPTPNSANGP